MTKRRAAEEEDAKARASRSYIGSWIGWAAGTDRSTLTAEQYLLSVRRDASSAFVV